jgi:hypothetical protein
MAMSFPHTITAQTGPLNDILDSYADYNGTHLQEKIYVHTDRSYYLCGEILWYKAYLTNAATDQPLSVSKVVYVEVLNSLHQPVLQGKVGIAGGTGSGSFEIPVSLSSGNYELRAYTNWMKNDSPGLYFKKVITIVNTTRNLDSAVTEKKTTCFAGFFPEGGNLVSGLTSVIGFKVNDQTGRGVGCRGILVDQSQDTVADFQSSRFGMGQFSFTPQSGKHYTALITLADSTVLRKNLPDVYDRGIVMHLSTEGENHLKISVQSAGISPADMYLVGVTRQHIDFAKTFRVENNQAVLLISKDSLEDGMTRLTLFNIDRQPVAERLFFKRPDGGMMIAAKPDMQNYKQRSKVSISLSTTDQSGAFLDGNLSASVYRVDSLHAPVGVDIVSYMWLTSELRGYIENPGYYLAGDNPRMGADLENLLLTQGWRSFDWKKVLDHGAPAFANMAENYGQIITGRVTTENGSPAPGILVYLSVAGRRVQLSGCKSDRNGMVHFDMKDFYGPGQIVLQTNTSVDSTYRLEVFSPFSEQFSSDRLPVLHVGEENGGDLQKANLYVGIENAYHQKEKEKWQPFQMDSLPFYYKASKTYLLDNYTRFTTMEEVLREYVNEVNISRKGKKYHFFTLNAPGFALHDMQPAEIIFYSDPLVLMDGVPVFDLNKVMAYDPLKVRKLEVVTSQYYYGPITADGIVSLTTYKGDLNGFTLNPHDLVMDYDGLQQQRIFYSPDYSGQDALQSRLPDFRDVLYWSPDIRTTSKGEGQISFYTGDISGRYVVVFQGISSTGKVGATRFFINVGK